MKLPVSISGTTPPHLPLPLSFHSVRDADESRSSGRREMTGGRSVVSSMEIDYPEINIRIFLSNLLHFSTRERLAY